MSNTPRGAPELAPGQAVPETTVNEQIRHTEAGAGYHRVADRVTAPPGSCADGACYIIIATATGAFAGKEGQIACAMGASASNGWDYTSLGTLGEGTLAYVQDEDATYKWSGSAWATVPAGGDMVAANNLSDVASAATSRGNLGLAIGSNVQAWDADLDALAAASGTNTIYYRSAANTWTAVSIGTGLSFSGGTLTCTVSAGGSGTVTSVSAGTGLSGGPITTTGSLALDLTHANTWTGKQDLSAGGDLTPASTPSTTAIGYLGSPQNTQNGAYTTVMSDAGKHIYHTSASAHTWTIDSNANVAYPIGTILTFINESGGGNVTLAITSDTLRWGASTGSRTLAANGTATAIKVASTTWRLTGDGIT